MSNANVDLVKSMYDAFTRGDIASILDASTENIIWESVGSQHDFPTLGRRDGRNGAQEFFASVAEHLSFSEFAPREYCPSGDRVFVLGRYAMTVKKTGRAFASDWCHVFTIDGGKVAEFREFTDTAQAAAAYRG
jgi:ketosteroid isomerase-like protein